MHDVFFNALIVLLIQATENLGCVMIFTLVSAAQDYLLQLVEDIKNGIEEEKKRQREEELRLEELKVRVLILFSFFKLNY